MTDFIDHLARNPRTGLLDSRWTAHTASMARGVVASARLAQPEWEALGPERRCEILGMLADVMESRASELRAALEHDTGRSDMDVRGTLRRLRVWSRIGAQALADANGNPTDIAASPSGMMAHVVHRNVLHAYPTVGVIAPWNFPLLLALIDAVPALVAGCAVVIKPSEITPRFVPILQQIIDSVPDLEKVMKLVSGGPEVGKAVVSSTDTVCFTGSVATGKRVAVAAAEAMIPVHLELGGKDAAVVLPGTDLVHAARAIAWAATANAGQVCTSIERVYVVDEGQGTPAASSVSAYDAFVAGLVAVCKQLSLSFPLHSSGSLGPVIMENQAQIVLSHLRDAVEKGAKIACGGRVRRLGGGLFVEPTVICGVTHDMLLMTEETFASIIPVMRVNSVDDAIQKANDTKYGLSGCVFGPTAEAAQSVATRIRAGAMTINDANLKPFVDGVAFTAFGESGVGPMSRSSGVSIRRFVRTQALITNTHVSMPASVFQTAKNNEDERPHSVPTVPSTLKKTGSTGSHPPPNIFWPRIDVSAVETAVSEGKWLPLDTDEGAPAESSLSLLVDALTGEYEQEGDAGSDVAIVRVTGRVVNDRLRNVPSDKSTTSVWVLQEITLTMADNGLQKKVPVLICLDTSAASLGDGAQICSVSIMKHKQQWKLSLYPTKGNGITRDVISYHDLQLATYWTPCPVCVTQNSEKALYAATILSSSVDSQQTLAVEVGRLPPAAPQQPTANPGVVRPATLRFAGIIPAEAGVSRAVTCSRL